MILSPPASSLAKATTDTLASSRTSTHPVPVESSADLPPWAGRLMKSWKVDREVLRAVRVGTS
jgi:hypothetical protein